MSWNNILPVDLVREKPYKGILTNWAKRSCNYGLGYYIIGTFLGHPEFDGMNGHTSYVVKHNEETGEIETRNSRYVLDDKEVK